MYVTRNEATLVRLDFANGWTVSLRLDRRVSTSCASWHTASGIARTGFHFGEQEASDDEVAAYIAEVAGRPPL